jgi:hypothetical protein
MQGKGFLKAMFLVGVGLVLVTGCAGNTQSGVIISSIMINAPADEVWDTLCNMDMTEVHSWMKEIKNKRGDGLCDIGNSEEHVQQALGQTVTLHVVTTEVVIKQKAETKYNGDLLGIHGTTTYLLSPEGDETRLTLVMQGAGQPPAGITFEVVKREFQKAADEHLAKIKAKMEE